MCSKMLLVQAVFFLLLPALIVPLLAECDVPVPDTAQRVTEQSETRSRIAVLVCQNEVVAMMGDENTVYLAPNASASITGRDNVIYAAAGATVTVMGGGNQIVYDAGAMVSDIGTDNRLELCTRLNLDAAGASEACGFARDASADASNNLIGTWKISEARLMDMNLKTDGKIIFYKENDGFADYKIQLGERTLPQIGAFEWDSDQQQLAIKSSGKKMKWRRLKDEPQQQVAEFELAGEGKVVLVLVRMK